MSTFPEGAGGFPLTEKELSDFVTGERPELRGKQFDIKI